MIKHAGFIICFIVLAICFAIVALENKTLNKRIYQLEQVNCLD